MIDRHIAGELRQLIAEYPIVTLLGAKHSYLVYAGEPFVFSDDITALKHDQMGQIFGAG